MATAAQHLESLGFTVDRAREFIFANYEHNLAFILQVSDQYDVTNAMLAEIVGGGFTASQVMAYFAAHGLDSSILEPEPPEIPPYEDGYAVARILGVDDHIDPA